MEFTLLGVILFIVILVMISRSKSEIRNLTSFISQLSIEIKTLKDEINALRSSGVKTTEERVTEQKEDKYEPYRPKVDKDIRYTPAPTAEPEIPKQPEPPPPAETPELPKPPVFVFDEEPVSLHDEPVERFSEPQAPKESQTTYAESESSYDKWLSKNPDLEKFIGENLINKIGIAILVLGIAFFVKYAIDQNWINEVGRVCIGMGCGAILVGLAHYLRNSYRSFSSVLAGGGIAVFYFTIAFAFHQYRLMPQTAAFIIMVVITAFAVALSVLYNRLELAIIAAIGGFLAPFLVSNGQGNYVVLFSYLIILNIGMLSLAWFKRWPVINIISLFFTEIIYASWLSITIVDHKPVSYPVALMFATILYLIFMGMNMINQVRNRQQFKAIDFVILLLLSCSYYAAGIVLLRQWNDGAYQGLFTLSIGIINLLLAWYVYKNGKADRNLLFLLIGLTFSFITLTIPIQLHGHAITLFWSAEFVLLYWLAVYSEIRLFKYSSAIVCALTLISLLIDWDKASTSAGPGLLVIFNNLQGIVTNITVIAAFAVYGVLLRKNKGDEYILGLETTFAAPVMFFAAAALLYITCLFGVNLYFHHLSTYEIPNIYYRLITELFALVLIILLQRGIFKASGIWPLVLLIACFVFYLGSSELMANVRDGVLHGHYAQVHLVWHWTAGALMGLLIYLTIRGLRTGDNWELPISNRTLQIVITIISVVFLSVELMHIYVVIGYRKDNTGELVRQYGKAGLTALWALCSFTLMWLGMKHKQKVLRIFSLTLFSIVLVKLFTMDISGISEGAKIFAFILLGVLLLVVSFMYQKLKKIIIDDHKE